MFRSPSLMFDWAPLRVHPECPLNYWWRLLITLMTKLQTRYCIAVVCAHRTAGWQGKGKLSWQNNNIMLFPDFYRATQVKSDRFKGSLIARTGGNSRNRLVCYLDIFPFLLLWLDYFFVPSRRQRVWSENGLRTETLRELNCALFRFRCTWTVLWVFERKRIVRI